MARKGTKRRREPVYEKLDKDACYIISKSSDDVLYACNVKGDIKLKRVKIPKEAS